MAAGTFVLAITAIFATKANKKFTQVTTAYLVGAPAYYLHNDLMTTVSGHNRLAATVYTVNAGADVIDGKLVTKGTNHHVVYYRP